jgi:hypothetical protein
MYFGGWFLATPSCPVLEMSMSARFSALVAVFMFREVSVLNPVSLFGLRVARLDDHCSAPRRIGDAPC